MSPQGLFDLRVAGLISLAYIPVVDAELKRKLVAAKCRMKDLGDEIKGDDRQSKVSESYSAMKHA